MSRFRLLALFLLIVPALPVLLATHAWIRSGAAEDMIQSPSRAPSSSSPNACQHLSEALEIHRQLDFDDFDWTSAAADSLLKSLTQNPMICVTESSFTPDLKVIADRLCPLIRKYGPLSQDVEDLRNRLKTAYLELDGAFFMSGHPIWNLSNPCEEGNAHGNLNEIRASARLRRCPAYWSPARCARVLRHLEVNEIESWDL